MTSRGWSNENNVRMFLLTGIKLSLFVLYLIIHPQESTFIIHSFNEMILHVFNVLISVIHKRYRFQKILFSISNIPFSNLVLRYLRITEYIKYTPRWNHDQISLILYNILSLNYCLNGRSFECVMPNMVLKEVNHIICFKITCWRPMVPVQWLRVA